MTELAVSGGRGEPKSTKLPLIRRAMVRQMVQGAAIPCFYLRLTADLTDLVAARAALKKSGTAQVVPSLNDFILRAVAMALRDHPEVNSSYGEEGILTYPRVNVGLAIAVPGALVVPAVYDADRLGVFEIAVTVRELVSLAERRKLSRELLSDPTFTLSNLGMYGIEEFDPIINPPQAAILAVGAASPDGAGRLLVRLTLGCDHRVLTGAEAAPFLASVRDRLQSPSALLDPPADDDEEQNT
jgi:pyruvate dehydrogenase E2 component (dihydrolipoamide acetyltransferase)